MFFESSSPLRTEAENWFLKELRGRYDVVLKFIARHNGCMHSDLQEHVRQVSGDFPLTARIEGYWDRGDTEIDLVAINGTDQIIRFGSCKRSADKLIADLSVFDGHIDRFLNEFPEYRNWQIERVSLAPVIPDNIRRQMFAQGRLAQDLHELTAGL